ncbi:MAG: Hpt domain-containing protein, partial [Candidatus Tectomicrobia bacterium]
MTNNGGQDYSDTSMLHLFHTEVETQVVLLNDGLLALERDPQAADALESLMRGAHSIKGAARIVQIGAAEKVAHVMEDCFVAAQEGNVRLASDHIEVLLQGVDMLMRIAQDVEDGAEQRLSAHHAAIEPLVAALSAILIPGSAPHLETPMRAEETQPLPAQAPPPEPAGRIEPPPPAQEQSVPAQPTLQASGDKDRVLRVTAENLNRLMGLAGESLVESRWLQPFAGSLLQLKSSQVDLSDVLEKMRE